MNVTPSFTEHFAALASSYDAVLSDVWGVIHNGVAAFPEACEALTRFRAKGGRVVLITNAPRPGAVVVRLLDRLSVPPGAERLDLPGDLGPDVDHLLRLQGPGRAHGGDQFPLGHRFGAERHRRAGAGPEVPGTESGGDEE